MSQTQQQVKGVSRKLINDYCNRTGKKPGNLGKDDYYRIINHAYYVGITHSVQLLKQQIDSEQLHPTQEAESSD